MSDDRPIRDYLIIFQRLDETAEDTTFTVSGATPCFAQAAGFNELEAFKRANNLLESSWRMRSLTLV